MRASLRKLDTGYNIKVFYKKNHIRGVIYVGLIRWIASILIILWLLGFVLHIGGGMIHILIVIAVIMFIFDLVSGR